MAEPLCTQKEPFVREVEPGRYAWCACGRTSDGPYCDGSHKGTGFKPRIVDVEEKKTIAWCGCKRSGDQPFCDGSHAGI